MDILNADTTEQFVRSAVAWITAVIHESVAARGKAVIGLSGGSTPKPVYTMLATDQHIPWHLVTFFLTDERYVPPTHPDSNQHMVRSTLLTREAKNAVLMVPRTELLLEKCVTDFGADIQKLGAPDLVILGMGDDGHIVSLFPPVPPEAFGPAAALHTQTEVFAVKDRITVTFPTLLHAKKRLFLIGGEKKRALLKKMQDTNEDVSLYPAQYLFDEKTTWMIAP